MTSRGTAEPSPLGPTGGRVEHGSGPRAERGSGTVLAVAVIGVVAAVLVGALVLGSALVAAQRARTAADLAALAGAGALLHGDAAEACATAASVARDNRAVLEDCRVLPGRSGLVLPVVEVRVGVGPASSLARAGGVLPE